MWAVYVVVAAVIYFIGNTLFVAGAFKSIQPHQEGITEKIYIGIYGAEDMDLDEATGKLYISSANRWNTQQGLPADDGIWVLDVDSSQSSPSRLATNYPGEFHPHGISFLRTDSTTQLWVVNHNPAGNFVEVFMIKNDSLLHQRSLEDPSMCCPNDVVAVSANQGYVTNDHGTRKGFKRTLEDYGRLPFSSLLYFDGKRFTTAYGGLRYGNGVNISNDGKQLYLAETTGRKVLTFDRDAATGSLTLVNTFQLDTGVDNIDVDANGHLWIAAHPKLLAFVGHAKDSTKKSPSQVLRLTPLDTEGFQVTEVMMEDGRQLSGSSIAVRYKDELFVGGVFEPKILRIRLKQP